MKSPKRLCGQKGYKQMVRINSTIGNICFLHYERICTLEQTWKVADEVAKTTLWAERVQANGLY